MVVETCPLCNPNLHRGDLCATSAAREAAADAEERAREAELLAMDADAYHAWLDAQNEEVGARFDAGMFGEDDAA